MTDITAITDTQLLTLAMAVVIPLSLLLYSNSRITDAKETLRAEMGTLRAEIGELRAEMRSMRGEILAALKIHELEHHNK